MIPMKYQIFVLIFYIFETYLVFSVFNVFKYPGVIIPEKINVNSSIVLVHYTTYENFPLILKTGLKSARAIGRPIPTNDHFAMKSYDIFFDTVKNNDLNNVNVDFWVAVCVRRPSRLNANNRLYTYNMDKLHTIPLDLYANMTKQDIYSQFNGSGEIRIAADYIYPKNIYAYGFNGRIIYTTHNKYLTANGRFK